LDQFIEKHCSGTTPQVVVIANSTNRQAALLAGEIDAASLQLDDWLELDQEAPGQYNALVQYAQEFPDIQTLGFHANSEFAAAHPELVKDFVRALIEAQRAIQDKTVLKANAIKYLEMDDATAETQGTAYLERNVWDVNGGLTEANIQTTVDLVVKAGFLSADLKAADLVDLTYLNAVLDEIGRQ
jgi:ABC-type nitrate/sulfonate/bicarbonate transport system substrate-binding protein